MMLAASIWSTVIAPLVTLTAAVVAVGSVGWAETRRLRSQHHHEERRKLQALIGRYRARLLEAAVDWDRRMEQLYASRDELAERAPRPSPEARSTQEDFLNDNIFYGHPDPALRIYGKFCNREEYVFRSYVYRFLALCAIARKFEAEAFFIDHHVARREDFEFLKYAKSLLWAPTTKRPARARVPGGGSRAERPVSTNPRSV